MGSTDVVHRRTGLIEVKASAPLRARAEESVELFEKGGLAGVQRILGVLAATRVDAYRCFADACGIALDAVSVEMRAGLSVTSERDGSLTMISVSSLRALTKLRGLKDVADAERLSRLVERMAPTEHPVMDRAGIASEVVLAY